MHTSCIWGVWHTKMAHRNWRSFLECHQKPQDAVREWTPPWWHICIVLRVPSYHSSLYMLVGFVTSYGFIVHAIFSPCHYITTCFAIFYFILICFVVSEHFRTFFVIAYYMYNTTFKFCFDFGSDYAISPFSVNISFFLCMFIVELGHVPSYYVCI